LMPSPSFVRHEIILCMSFLASLPWAFMSMAELSFIISWSSCPQVDKDGQLPLRILWSTSPTPGSWSYNKAVIQHPWPCCSLRLRRTSSCSRHGCQEFKAQDPPVVLYARMFTLHAFYFVYLHPLCYSLSPLHGTNHWLCPLLQCCFGAWNKSLVLLPHSS
jgi:hypothetical protein